MSTQKRARSKWRRDQPIDGSSAPITKPRASSSSSASLSASTSESKWSVAPPPPPPPPAAEIGAEVAMAKCSGCELKVPKADFSAMQMRKKGKRKCKGCIAAKQ